jgi:RND family efflux transporter MFP subunit
MKVRIIIALLALAAAGGVVGFAARHATARVGQPTGKETPLVVSTTAKRQDLLLTVTQTGVVEAKNSRPVIPEISGRIQWVCENGIVVSAGDTIMRLDPTKLQEALADLLARYDGARRRQTESEIAGQARMTEIRLRLKRAEDDVAAFARQQEVALRQARDAIAFHEQELAHRREDAEVKRRLAAKGLIAATEVEREDAAVKAAAFALEREKSDYALKESQAKADEGERRRNVINTTRDMSRARGWSDREMRMSGNEVENLDLQLARAREDLSKTTLTAPAGGLVVLSSQGGWRGDTHLPRLGDYASQGREVASIVSLDHMQVKLELDQTQITGVTMGQAAEVTIEALPGTTLTGKVSAIGQTARRPPMQGWGGMSSTATFPVTIDLPPTGKALIRPGMRASARIVSRRIKQVVVVPNGCVFRRDGKSIVFVQRKGKFVAGAVTTGESNEDYTAITSGLEAGERIALNDLGSPPATTSRREGQQESPP